mmetsp:Transcript_24629/g.57814  ORF Transcript_24629/g.57814 Transcript_24629/m.57814 type:complete len:502 (-) Transcript_24629:469-1974(-)
MKDFDDEIKEDPRDVDDIMSKELMNLSMQDRNAINEEIHGVNCLAVEETQELLRNLLHDLAVVLDNVLPPAETRAYRRSQKIPHSYVNTIDFRLRFLRCEVFDAKKAARRMAFYLNTVQDFFGDFALERPIRLSDFNKEEQTFMRKGFMQLLPYRDRSGRRIGVIFPGKELAQSSARLKAKIALYLSWTAGNEVETQRMGVVILIWYDKSFQLLHRPVQNKPKFHEVWMLRICAIHLCTPDTPLYRIRRGFITMRMAHNRLKLRVHIGNTVENNYKLQCFGIPTETIPITYSGTVKFQPMRQWIRLRTFLEEPIYQDTAEIRSIIECPHPNDIVFRQGSSFLSHPGNATFRTLIAGKIEEIENLSKNLDRENQLAMTSIITNSINRKKLPTKAKDNKRYTTRVIVKEVMDEIKRQRRRVLNWNDAQDCWKLLTDEMQIYMKIVHLVREYRNAAKAQANRQSSQSDTFMFCSSKRVTNSDAISTVSNFFCKRPTGVRQREPV